MHRSYTGRGDHVAKLPFFFYGTLLDPDVQRIVIRRTLKRREMTRAVLRGYRRVFVAGAWYPTLVPADDATVRGFIVEGMSRRERSWIDYFEDDDYVLGELAVTSRQGRTVPVASYMPPHTGVAADQDWTLEDWRRRYKAAYIQRSKRWMVTDFDQNW